MDIASSLAVELLECSPKRMRRKENHIEKHWRVPRKNFLIVVHYLVVSGSNSFLKLPVVGRLTNYSSIFLRAEDNMLGEYYLPALQPCTHQGGRPQCESFCSLLLSSD
jgi:hypothetical protein